MFLFCLFVHERAMVLGLQDNLVFVLGLNVLCLSLGGLSSKVLGWPLDFFLGGFN